MLRSLPISVALQHKVDVVRTIFDYRARLLSIIATVLEMLSAYAAPKLDGFLACCVHGDMEVVVENMRKLSGAHAAKRRRSEGPRRAKTKEYVFVFDTHRCIMWLNSHSRPENVLLEYYAVELAQGMEVGLPPHSLNAYLKLLRTLAALVAQYSGDQAYSIAAAVTAVRYGALLALEEPLSIKG